MQSINQLQRQLKGLKAQETEHRRSALIQDLREQQREQELIIDVLKQTLLEKLPEFQDSPTLVNDLVIKKTAGNSLKFRPKSREELENELHALGKNFQRTVEKLKQEQRNAASKEEKLNGEEDIKEEKEVADNDPAAAVLPDETFVEDQIVRKKHKIALLRDQLERRQAENVELVQEKENLAEKYLQLQEETQFLRDISMEDAGAKDEERLQQLELIQSLRSRELELQDELEHQQKKWATDRDTMHQRLRLLEKEKKLAEDEATRGGEELAQLQQKKGKCALQQEIDELKVVVQEEKDQKLLLANRIEKREK
eukprot:jgi/Phyca11/7205/fgenesh1_pm.PHYCAscaffold_17_\